MKSEHIESYRQDLLALATKINQSLAHNQRELLGMDFSDVPGGPIAASGEILDGGIQERECGLIKNEENLLGEVNAALARIDAGTFGRCMNCKASISQTRLDAIPYASRCIRCAEAAMKEPVML